jgi:N-acyl-D-amino-acid deacylase
MSLFRRTIRHGRHLRALALVVFLVASTAAALNAPRPTPHAQKTPAFDLVITGARVVDGTGNPWFRADVAVKDGRIARVGRVEPAEGAKVIDARGLVLAPGFVDVHTHVENIYEQPEAENFVRMGVTSLVTGNCGSSALDVGGFLGRMKETPLAVNLASLVAHGTVRREVLGEVNRRPGAEELRRMEALVERAMRDGAVGLSTGLIYVPGTYAETEEVVALARVAARYGGLYATHMRDEGNRVVEAVKESIEIGERAGLPVDISHFKISSKKLWGKSTVTLGLVEAARARGLPVTVDQYLYTASSTNLDTLLPGWVREGGREEGKRRLSDAASRERAAREMRETLKASGFKDYAYAVVARYEPDASFAGRSIAELAQASRGKSDLKNQIEQVFEMYAGGGAQMVYHKMSEDDVRRIIREPWTMVASDSSVRRHGEGAPHPRGYGNNARLLGLYVRELRLLSLEDAVRKMTSLPAQTFGLRGRGLIREGFAADLVLFDEQTIADRATFDRPHQYPVGISRVFVNGVAVFEDGRMTAARPGAALRNESGEASVSASL